MKQFGLFAILLTLAASVGCERDDQIRTYSAPKEPLSASPQLLTETSHSESDEQPAWTVPEGWVQEGARPMRVATFRTSADPHAAEVVVTRFAKDGFGSMLDNINRWRGMVGLDPVKAESDQPTEQLTVGGLQATLFDMTGPGGDARPARRLMIVMVPSGPTVWFFRFTGAEAVVQQHKPEFDKFVSSVTFPG